jgi:hypothetical protein
MLGFQGILLSDAGVKFYCAFTPFLQVGQRLVLPTFRDENLRCVATEAGNRHERNRKSCWRFLRSRLFQLPVLFQTVWVQFRA